MRPSLTANHILFRDVPLCSQLEPPTAAHLHLFVYPLQVESSTPQEHTRKKNGKGGGVNSERRYRDPKQRCCLRRPAIGVCFSSDYSADNVSHVCLSSARSCSWCCRAYVLPNCNGTTEESNEKRKQKRLEKLNATVKAEHFADWANKERKVHPEVPFSNVLWYTSPFPHLKQD